MRFPWKKGLIWTVSFLVLGQWIVSFCPNYLLENKNFKNRPIKKVLIISHTDIETTLGGIETVCLNISKELQKRGIECEFLYEYNPLFLFKILFGSYDAVHVAHSVCIHRFLNFLKASYTTAQHMSSTSTHTPLRWQEEMANKFFSKKVFFVNPRSAFLAKELGFNAVYWPLGCDLETYKDCRGLVSNNETVQKDIELLKTLPKPLLMLCGRMVDEKNISPFLDLDVPGTKFVVGDGPLLPALKEKYKDVVFFGRRDRSVMPYYYSEADIFATSSLMEASPMMIQETLSCGTPVAGLVGASGVSDKVNERCGVLAPDLKTAVLEVWDKIEKGELTRENVRKEVSNQTWEKSTDVFLENQVPYEYIHIFSFIKIMYGHAKTFLKTRKP